MEYSVSKIVAQKKRYISYNYSGICFDCNNNVNCRFIFSISV